MERRFFPKTRSFSLSELFEDGVCVGVLPGNRKKKMFENRSFIPLRGTLLFEQENHCVIGSTRL